MATDAPSPATQEQADLEAVCRHASEGKRITDPELLARIRASAARVREDALQKFGVQDIGVQIIRELRDGE
jgi:hypothetical protein